MGPEGGAPRFGPGHRGRRINLLKLAQAQRALLWAFLGYVLAYFGGQALIGAAAASGGVVGVAVAGAVGAAALAMMVWVIVSVVRMAVAYGVHPAMGVLGGLCLVIPCAGVLLLAALNMRVTATLQTQGVKVGLLGPPPSEMTKLRLGVCRGCGYDLRGVSAAVCPECGLQRGPGA
jgi:hypothetical protein